MYSRLGRIGSVQELLKAKPKPLFICEGSCHRTAGVSADDEPKNVGTAAKICFQFTN